MPEMTEVCRGLFSIGSLVGIGDSSESDLGQKGEFSLSVGCCCCFCYIFGCLFLYKYGSIQRYGEKTWRDIDLQEHSLICPA